MYILDTGRDPTSFVCVYPVEPTSFFFFFFGKDSSFLLNGLGTRWKSIDCKSEDLFLDSQFYSIALFVYSYDSILCLYYCSFVVSFDNKREGNGTPLQYSCLENPMDGGAWWAAVHGVAKSRTRLSDFTFTFYFHALEKEMATHSSVLAWRIPGRAEPDGLPSMGLHRFGHDWSDLAAAAQVLQVCSINFYYLKMS